MTMRTIGLAAALAMGVGSAALAQGVIVDDEFDTPRQERVLQPFTGLLDPSDDLEQDQDRDNTGVSDKVEDDMYENENGITNGN